MSTIEIRLAPREAAAFALAPGLVLRLARDCGTREWEASCWLDGRSDPVYGRAYGEDFDGAAVCWHGDLRGISRGHFERDRAAWREAARLVSRGGTAIIEYEQQEHHGRLRWVSVRARLAEGVPS